MDLSIHKLNDKRKLTKHLSHLEQQTCLQYSYASATLSISLRQSKATISLATCHQKELQSVQ
jgi:hypothetical protein